jgi:tetratricopeptide (TPR) repeat protein
MKTRLLLSAISAAALLASGLANAHDGRYHVARNTELKQFTGNALPETAPAGAEVPLWENLVGHRFTSSTTSAEAQDYIDQAIMLAFGFNHAEAGRSFRQAQALDPECAICSWGEALVLGPNINAPMDPAANAPALAALEQAQRLAPGASPREQALVHALATRYSPDGDRSALDFAYADAMRDVAADFPDDDDIAVLYAESVMNLSPWDFWEADGVTPKGRMGDAIATLENVLARSPDHPGAIHLYIHAVEASTTPERAEPYADRLAAMDIGAGHLVHMPSHIYYRIGRYQDSLEANRRAVATDEAFFAEVAPKGIYAGGYYPHNIHFLMVSAQMAGDGPTVIEAAGKLSAAISDEMARAAPAFVQPIKAAPLFAHAQFSDPDTILAIERPSGDFPFVDAAWHYARGVAFASVQDIPNARAERAAIAAISENADLGGLIEGGIPAQEVLSIAVDTLDARIALARGDIEAAVRFLAAAKQTEDGLPYMEPRFWHQPVGQSLGAALLLNGDADAAEQAFEESLKLAPNNGWALFGLSEVYKSRGENARVEEALQKLDEAWIGSHDLLALNRL